MPANPESLHHAVDDLSSEVRVLRDAVDELREVLEWQTRNPQRAARCDPLLKSMAESPTASDWAEKLRFVTGVPAIVEQRIAARYHDQITRLQELLLSLVVCPELDPGRNLDAATLEILSDIETILNGPVDVPLTEAEIEEQRRSCQREDMFRSTEQLSLFGSSNKPDADEG